jgi:hypothetical protein
MMGMPGGSRPGYRILSEDELQGREPWTYGEPSEAVGVAEREAEREAHNLLASPDECRVESELPSGGGVRLKRTRHRVVAAVALLAVVGVIARIGLNDQRGQATGRRRAMAEGRPAAGLPEPPPREPVATARASRLSGAHPRGHRTQGAARHRFNRRVPRRLSGSEVAGLMSAVSDHPASVAIAPQSGGASAEFGFER